MLLTLAFVLGLGSAAHADTNFSPIAACEARSGTLRAVHPGTVENPSAESSSEVLCGFQRGGNTSSDGDDDVQIFYVDSRSDSAVSCLVAASTPDLATISSTSWRWSSSTPGGATSFTASYTGRGHLQFNDLDQPANSTRDRDRERELAGLSLSG